jgi:hypothetical protein
MSASSAIASRLDDIFKQRRFRHGEAELLKGRLGPLLGSLDAFKDFLSRLRSHSDPEIAASASAMLPELSGLLQKGQDRQVRLQRLETRFSRSTLNLGVVGRARQGKSTLLKSLSGLGDEAIPTGRDFTTGAASILLNEPSMDAGDAEATIHFHDEASFLRDVVKPYWQSNFLDLEAMLPHSVEEFSKMRLPEKPGPHCNDMVTGETLLKELVKVQQDLPAFRERLTGAVKEKVSKESIRAYVAQTDASEGRISTWRAVRRAEIRCAFPKREVGRIALVDTPGLGQITAGLEDYVRETLGGALDFVLFVRLPPEQGPVIQKEDTQLYNLLTLAVPELPLAEWCALVVNQTPSNAAVLDIFERHVDESAMRFAGGRNRVDCKDAEGAGGLLLKVLDYVVAHLPLLDGRLLAAAQRDLAAFTDECDKLLARARNGFPQGNAVVADEETINSQFEFQWEGLGVGLHTLLEKYRHDDQVKEAEITFNAALAGVKARINGGCGISIEEARRGINAPDLGEAWFANQRHRLRTLLTGYFEELDNCLEEIFNKMRLQVLEILLRKEDGGGLEPLLNTAAQEGGQRSPWESLGIVCRECNGSNFAKIFERLSSASLSFRGFIQHRILDKMSALSEWTKSGDPTAFHFPGSNAEDCQKVLDLAWRNAGEKAYHSVAEMACEVGLARWAFTLEFVDGILRSGGAKAAERFWRIFYKQSRGVIWPDVFQKLQYDAVARAEWARHLKDSKEKADDLSLACRKTGLL